jgi:aspartate/methionine/tyrosine aminotransferase
LSSSDCETLSIEELLSLEPKTKEDNINKILAQRLGYTESSGDPELKKLIAQHYQDGPEKITSDNVLVGSGAEELIYIFFRANFKQGKFDLFCLHPDLTKIGIIYYLKIFN